MATHAGYNLASHRILTREEVELCNRYTLANWDSWSMSRRNQAMVFRLATCCGLRGIEIRGLRCTDIMPTGPKPIVRVRAGTTKSRTGKYRQGRAVPLWWSPTTRDLLEDWKAMRVLGNGPTCSVISTFSTALPGACEIADCSLKEAFRAFLRRVLGTDRARQVSIHAGRHTFITHALYAGYPIHEVQAAAGHASLSSTGCYAHLVSGLGSNREPIPMF